MGDEAGGAEAGKNNDASPSLGVQARLDEYAKQKGELERQNAILQAQMQALMETATNLARQQPTEQAPQIEIEPEFEQKINKLLGPTFKKFEQTLESFGARLASSSLATSKEHPKTIERAQSLAQRPEFRGWSEQHLLNYARGMLAGEGVDIMEHKRPQAQPPNGTLSQHGNQPDLTPKSEALPANFDSLPFKQKMELLKKRVAGQPLARR